MERRMRQAMVMILTVMAGAVVQTAVAGGTLSADIGDFAACEARFAKLMKTVLPKAARRMADGTQVYNPDAGKHYDATWLRDFTYMAEGETVPREDVVNEAMIFLNAVSKDFEGVDCVRHDGRPCFMPGGGRMGAKPVADGGPFTISLAYLAWKQSDDGRFLAVPTLDKLVRVFAAIPRAPDGSGLVWIDPTVPFERCPYGFTDTVRKQGACLFTSLLKVEAGRRLAEMLEAGGQAGSARKVREETDKVAAAVNRVFWDESVGLYRAATVKCREHDVWGSAFAVWLDVAPADRADRIAATFKAQYDGLVHVGQVRHLLPGVYWEDARGADGSPIPHDVYQNGAYWGTATGWFCWTLARKDRALALRTFRDLATDYEKGGACECHYAAKVPCPWKDPRPCAGGYPANLGLPLAALHRFMFAGCYTVTRGADWIPVEYKKSIAKGSALDFSGMGLADAPAGCRVAASRPEASSATCAEAIADYEVRTGELPRDPNEKVVAPPRGMKLVLLVGQSNMAGRAPVPDEDRKPLARACKLNRDNRWVEATAPFHYDRKTVGMSPANEFVRRYLADHQGETVGIVPCAVGGSRQATWYATGTGKVGANFRSALERAKIARRDGEFIAILWHQGESDAERPLEELKADYPRQFAEMVAAFRKETGPVPVVVGEIGWYMPQLAQRINPVLNALPETVPNCRCVSAAGLGNCDEWHFDLPATRTLGSRYYEAWRELSSLGKRTSVP